MVTMEKMIKRQQFGTEAYFRKIQRKDKIAKGIIVTGGFAIVIGVIGILFLIAGVAMPLFLPPQSQLVSEFQLQGDEEIIATGLDEYLETGYTISKSGEWTYYDIGKQQKIDQLVTPHPETANRKINYIEYYGDFIYSLLWDDGAITVEHARFPVRFEGSQRIIDHKVVRLMTVPAEEGGDIPVKALVRLGEGDEARNVVIKLFEDNRIGVTQQIIEEDLFGNQEIQNYTTVLSDEPPGKITQITLSQSGKWLYAGTENGYLLRWDLSEPDDIILRDRRLAFSDGRAITSIRLVFGGNSISVGDAKGELSTWFPVDLDENGMKQLHKIHTLTKHSSTITNILPSLQDKSVISLDEEGKISIDHMTSENRIFQFDTGTRLQTFGINARNTGLIAIDHNNKVFVWAMDNPHPEISFSVLFNRVWYEGYSMAEYIWQSSSASDDFEPKLSMMPLVFGSLKGTFYALIFAVPLALMGAIYTSQFAKDTFRKWVKPGVEIMAAMPSVIIGFLAALWLAPIIEGYVVTVFLCILTIPAVAMGAIALWPMFRESNFGKRTEKGYEFIAIIPILFLGYWLAVAISPGVENLLFDGNIKQWLFDEVGTRYDQRNSIIIAFGLGFMVIPIIFTISDDALTNVPHALKAASLALGASRWQTIWRIVIPSASPGIFAAIIIGFGRAVGETMVVLMATGNTPIMDWSIFNGMRTLSANIAVELPEAPVGGTLYRVLFLSAVILFIMTFFLNTLAEVIRQRLRKKYGQF